MPPTHTIDPPSAAEARTSVRDLVRAIQAEIRRGEFTPLRGSELLCELSALSGNCADELRTAEFDLARVKLAALESSDKANHAKIKAEASPEYLRRQEAKDTLNLVETLIAALKYSLRTSETEMRLSR